MRKMLLILLLVISGTAGCFAQGQLVATVAIHRVLSTPASHIAAVRGPGIRLELEGIYAFQGLLWIRLSVSNTSVLDFHALPVRLYIADRHNWRHRARQETPLMVTARHEKLLIPSDSTLEMCYGVPPRLPGKRQVLTLEYAERNGPRHLTFRLGLNELLHAKRLDHESKPEVRQPDTGVDGTVSGQ